MNTSLSAGPIWPNSSGASVWTPGANQYVVFGAMFQLTNVDSYRAVVVTAANTQAKLYNATVGAENCFPNKGLKGYAFAVIIDHMMNLELLLWGSRQSGGSATSKSMAISHAKKTLANHVRSDGTTFHVVNYNQTTGTVIAKYTAQGYSNSSTWARGQAWALYGFSIVYRETGDSTFLTGARRTADAFLRRLVG